MRTVSTSLTIFKVRSADPTLLNTSGAAQLLPRLDKASESGIVKATGTAGIETKGNEASESCLARSWASQRSFHGIDQSSDGTVKSKNSQVDKRSEPSMKSSLSTECRRMDNPSHRGGKQRRELFGFMPPCNSFWHKQFHSVWRVGFWGRRVALPSFCRANLEPFWDLGVYKDL